MSMLRRIRLEIAGIVQGVGFRPYLYRLAQRHALCGWVRNTPSGVELELEGPTEALSSFQDELARSTPPLAVVEQVRTVPLDGLVGYDRFTIRSSAVYQLYGLWPPLYHHPRPPLRPENDVHGTIFHVPHL